MPARRDRPIDDDKLLAEFNAYWEIADDLLTQGYEKQFALVAPILALQSARYARMYGDCGDQPKKLVLLRDVTEALAAVLATVRAGWKTGRTVGRGHGLRWVFASS